MAQVSAVDDVIAALLAGFTTAIGTAELTAAVYDARPATSAPDEAFMLVGDDGDPQGASEGAAVLEQDPATFDGSFDEQGTVSCAAIAQTGGDDMPACRAASKALMVAIEAWLRANPTLGGTVATSHIGDVSLWQTRNAQGTAVRRAFTVRYTAYQL